MRQTMIKHYTQMTRYPVYMLRMRKLQKKALNGKGRLLPGVQLIILFMPLRIAERFLFEILLQGCG